MLLDQTINTSIDFRTAQILKLVLVLVYHRFLYITVHLILKKAEEIIRFRFYGLELPIHW